MANIRLTHGAYFSTAFALWSEPIDDGIQGQEVDDSPHKQAPSWLLDVKPLHMAA